ncbi:hypothetical protein M3627_13405 [Psychrobacillus sp. MER TA 171]|nr:hypothetical protein [Psychrobacillus sp. MER TA 171]
MGNWLTDMEGMFTAGVKDITFQPSQWNAITFGSEIRTELFPKVYLDPNKLWVEERDKIIGTMITAKTFQALELKRMNTIDENVGENIQYHQYENGLLIKEYTENGTVYYEIVSKVEYKEEVVQVEPPKENKLLDGIQFGLDIVGLIPGIGEIADGANGVIYTVRGDKLNAGLSFAAMIPVAGWGSTATKFANKGSQLYQARNVLSDEKVASMFTPTYQEVVNGPLSRTQANMYMFKTDFNNMTPKSVIFNSPLTGNLSLSKPDVPTTSKSLEGNGNTEIKNVDVTTMGTDEIGLPPRYGERRISKELYDELRDGSPTAKLREKVNEGIEDKIGMPDPALPGKHITGRLQADHIVSMKNIAKMENFDKLTKEQQLKVLNNEENFLGLSEAANKSKGSKSYSDWTIYKKENIEVDPKFREEMIKKEKELEMKLQKQIDDFVEGNKKDIDK